MSEGGAGGGAPPLRCGAKLRTGGACALPSAAGRRRCFQHGGAAGIGAPKGNRNNWRDGFHGLEMSEERRRVNGFIRECLKVLRVVKQTSADGRDESVAPPGGPPCSE